MRRRFLKLVLFLKRSYRFSSPLAKGGLRGVLHAGKTSPSPSLPRRGERIANTFLEAALAAVLTLSAPVSGEPLSAGKWLVDLGRDYPLSPQAQVSDADAQITLLFMQAAGRIEPQLAEAYLWQYDMLTALGRDDQARQCLLKYVSLEPEDIWAHLNWLDLTIETLQTAEKRAQFCRSYLARSGLPKEVCSDLHRRLAEFHLNRGDLEHARAEAKAALDDYDLNFSARMLLDGLGNTPTTVVQRIRNLLTSLAASPQSVQLSRQLGDELMSLGMPVEADRWYQHAANVATLLPPATVPPHLLVARAWALTDAGQLDKADELAQEAIGIDPNSIDAYLVRAHIANKRNDPKTSQEAILRASDLWKSLLADAASRLDPEVVAEMAWFFAHYDKQPAEAEKLARSALVDHSKSIVARRALGAALVQLGRLAEARKILASVAEADTWAAVELAGALEAAGEHQLACERLQSAASRPAAGELRDTIANMMNKWQIEQSARPTASVDIKAMLEAFPSHVLDYPANPSKYLALSLRMSDQQLPPGEPWWCTVGLTNIGPFAITFGRDMMLMPDLLCSIDTQGDRARTSGPVIRISLNRATRLQPGQSIEITQTIDIGPIRSSMIGTPQVSHDVEVSALLNPLRFMSADGQEIWAPGVGGLLADPLRFRRASLIPTADEVRNLVIRSRTGEIKERIAATELLAMLLAERQHLAAGRLSYAGRRIDADKVRAAILDRLSDDDWYVRARLAECMRWFILDSKTTNAATRLLNDTHWLVRGLAMRMFADHYGHKFKKVLERSIKTDPDQWTRRLADALLARMNLTTQPAGIDQ